MTKYISDVMKTVEDDHSVHIELYKEEKEYAEKNRLVSADITLVEKNAGSRFSDAYIERCDKETEELIAEEAPGFLHQPIQYFKTHKNEFIYVESNSFDIIGVDAISLEVDDVFGTYTAMLGLKLQKKYELSIKNYLENKLDGPAPKYNLLFSQSDGLWDVNFAMDYIDGFTEDFTIEEAYSFIYRFLFTLVEAVEEEK